MSAFETLREVLASAVRRLAADGALPADAAERVQVEPPRDPAHGDAASNIAMLIAREAGRPPLEIARLIAASLAGEPAIVAAEAAPPGFLNLRIAPAFWQRQVTAILGAGEGYGRCTIGGGQPVNVEYVSANPTGPLHVGHGRGAVFGDALANVLEAAGWRVTREYYVNDGGAQIDALARSVHFRYRELLGAAEGPMPEGLYPGEYLVPVARQIVERDGRRWLELPEAAWLEPFRVSAIDAMMALIRDDLAALGIRHDVFSSERRLIAEGRVDEALATLESMGLLYTGTLPAPKGKPDADWEPVPQLLFASTRFGDDSDRPLRRSNGAWTYFAADIAYHHDKYRRGFRRQIDVWGADHGGYVKRMQAAVRAISGGEASLEVRICQLVNLLDQGKPLRMSKRAGRIVTLRDVVDEVGRDVVRFIMLSRKNDAPLDFDLAKVVEQSKDNPVFYVQYAHARIRSVFRNAVADGHAGWTEDLANAPVQLLQDPGEFALIRSLSLWPRVLEAAAVHAEPHRIVFHLHEVAAAFHALWTRGRDESRLRFLIADAPDLSRARLALLEATRTVLAMGLGLLGVRPVEELH